MGEQRQHSPQQLLGPGGHFPEQLRGQQSPCQSLFLFRPHFWAVIPDGSQAGDSNESYLTFALFQILCSPIVMDRKKILSSFNREGAWKKLLSASGVVLTLTGSGGALRGPYTLSLANREGGKRIKSETAKKGMSGDRSMKSWEVRRG